MVNTVIFEIADDIIDEMTFHVYTLRTHEFHSVPVLQRIPTKCFWHVGIVGKIGVPKIRAPRQILDVLNAGEFRGFLPTKSLQMYCVLSVWIICPIFVPNSYRWCLSHRSRVFHYQHIYYSSLYIPLFFITCPSRTKKEEHSLSPRLPFLFILRASVSASTFYCFSRRYYYSNLKSYSCLYLWRKETSAWKNIKSSVTFEEIKLNRLFLLSLISNRCSFRPTPGIICSVFRSKIMIVTSIFIYLMNLKTRTCFNDHFTSHSRRLWPDTNRGLDLKTSIGHEAIPPTFPATPILQATKISTRRNPVLPYLREYLRPWHKPQPITHSRNRNCSPSNNPIYVKQGRWATATDGGCRRYPRNRRRPDRRWEGAGSSRRCWTGCWTIPIEGSTEWGGSGSGSGKFLIAPRIHFFTFVITIKEVDEEIGTAGRKDQGTAERHGGLPTVLHVLGHHRADFGVIDILDLLRFRAIRVGFSRPVWTSTGHQFVVAAGRLHGTGEFLVSLNLIQFFWHDRILPQFVYHYSSIMNFRTRV